jgi:hypothetical protein
MEYSRETFEALRAECERLKHKLAFHEADIARAESLKEKVSALVFENDSLREKAATARAQVQKYQGLAMAVQRGLLVWTKTANADAFLNREAEKLRLLFSDLSEPRRSDEDKAVEYQGTTPIHIKVVE